METVLKTLEERIEAFVALHQKAQSRVAELEGRVRELEERLAGAATTDQRVQELEAQRDAMAERLQKVLDHIDSVLEPSGDER